MRSYTTHERKGSSRAKEPAIVYTAPYFAKENYTRLDKFLFARNENAEIDTAGVLSVLPTSTTDTDKLAITNNTEVSATVLQNAANFFAEKLQATQRTMPDSAYWNAVDYGNGVFVAVPRFNQWGNNDSFAATSPDGATWTKRSLPFSAGWQSIAYGNGVFVVIASGTSGFTTSPDGIVWTYRNLPVSTSWASIIFRDGIFVAVSNSTIAATSPDGIVWTQRVLPVSAGWTSVTFGNGVFVAVASNSSIAATSPDGIVWTQRVLPVNTNWWRIIFGNGVFLIINIDTSAFTYTSIDGVNWTRYNLPTSTRWGCAVFGNGIFVVIAGGVITSTIAATLLPAPTTRITETPTTLTLPANHSYFVKIT
jgi:hypothetical protein